jgi:hypothetical protein
MDPVEAQRSGLEQQMVEVRGTPSCDLDMLSAGLLEEEIDLGPYINTSAVGVSGLWGDTMGVAVARAGEGMKEGVTTFSKTRRHSFMASAC